MDQVSIKYSNIFQCKTHQNLPKFGFLVWKQTIWHPCHTVIKDWRIGIRDAFSVRVWPQTWVQTLELILRETKNQKVLNPFVNTLQLSSDWFKAEYCLGNDHTKHLGGIYCIRKLNLNTYLDTFYYIVTYMDKNEQNSSSAFEEIHRDKFNPKG
jgi:hypothetical protein